MINSVYGVIGDWLTKANSGAIIYQSTPQAVGNSGAETLDFDAFDWETPTGEYFTDYDRLTAPYNGVYELNVAAECECSLVPDDASTLRTLTASKIEIPAGSIEPPPTELFNNSITVGTNETLIRLAINELVVLTAGESIIAQVTQNAGTSRTFQSRMSLRWVAESE
jgi:hypothetical protein